MHGVAYESPTALLLIPGPGVTDGVTIELSAPARCQWTGLSVHMAASAHQGSTYVSLRQRNLEPLLSKDGRQSDAPVGRDAVVCTLVDGRPHEAHDVCQVSHPKVDLDLRASREVLAPARSLDGVLGWHVGTQHMGTELGGRRASAHQRFLLVRRSRRSQRSPAFSSRQQRSA